MTTEELKSEFEPLTKLMRGILDDKVEKLNVSYRIRRFAVCYHDVRVRLVCQHGAHHVSAGAERQLDDFLHGVQENDRGQSHALHYDGIDQRGVGRKSDKTVKDSIRILFDTSPLCVYPPVTSQVGLIHTSCLGRLFTALINSFLLESRLPHPFP